MKEYWECWTATVYRLSVVRVQNRGSLERMLINVFIPPTPLCLTVWAVIRVRAARSQTHSMDSFQFLGPSLAPFRTIHTIASNRPSALPETQVSRKNEATHEYAFSQEHRSYFCISKTALRWNPNTLTSSYFRQVTTNTQAPHLLSAPIGLIVHFPFHFYP